MGCRCVAPSGRSATSPWFSGRLPRPARCRCVAPTGRIAAARGPRRRPEAVPVAAQHARRRCIAPSGCSAAARGPRRLPEVFSAVTPDTHAAAASPIRAVAPRHAVHSAVSARRLLRGMRCAASLGAGTPLSAFGLRHVVGFFFAYFEHRRRRRLSHLRLRPVPAHRQRRHHLPHHFIYSESRVRHRHLTPRRLTPHPSSSPPLLVPVYACPVLATPPCAFVYDVSPGLASPVRRLVNID